MKQRNLKRELVQLEQQGSCLLCDYPLILGCHLHHVIASDEKGPDHPLNLIGLCANHHIVLECVRRHVAPKETQGTSSWLSRAQAALRIVEALPEAQRQLFNELAEPHPLRKEIHSGVERELQAALAADIAQADTRLLLAINKARPRIVLLWRVKQGRAPEPKTNDEWVTATAAVRNTLGPSDFEEVIALHLSALGLPFHHAAPGAAREDR